jgi:hypothetical protein
MKTIIRRTFGGLSLAYYFRNFVFGLILWAVLFFGVLKTESGILVEPAIFISISALLYPYSRFVYERIVAFILGDYVIISYIPILLCTKMMSMMLCFMLAIFIAPVGLLGLYFYHTKQANRG